MREFFFNVPVGSIRPVWEAEGFYRLRIHSLEQMNRTLFGIVSNSDSVEFRQVYLGERIFKFERGAL